MPDNSQKFYFTRNTDARFEKTTSGTSSDEDEKDTGPRGHWQGIPNLLMVSKVSLPRAREQSADDMIGDLDPSDASFGKRW